MLKDLVFVAYPNGYIGYVTKEEFKHLCPDCGHPLTQLADGSWLCFYGTHGTL